MGSSNLGQLPNKSIAVATDRCQKFEAAGRLQQQEFGQLRPSRHDGGLRKLGPLCGSPFSNDHSTLGFVVGPPISGNSHRMLERVSCTRNPLKGSFSTCEANRRALLFSDAMVLMGKLWQVLRVSLSGRRGLGRNCGPHSCKGFIKTCANALPHPSHKSTAQLFDPSQIVGRTGTGRGTKEAFCLGCRVDRASLSISVQPGSLIVNVYVP